jgi:hypothetical protein
MGEFVSRGGLTLEILREQRNLAERCGNLNLLVLTNDDADAVLLCDCGATLVGVSGVNENGKSTQYKKFRISIRAGE